jgi:hypothetical protein
MALGRIGRLMLAAGLLVFACPTALSAAGPAAKGKPAQLDFTKGDKPMQSRDVNLGATGLRGWMWAWRQCTTDSRQILVTEVAARSPADGVMLKGDVILGIDGKCFDSDARIAFGQALTAAETEAGKGILKLIRWREGKTDNVEIKLKVLGAYSATAPYDCPKSKAIFEQGCAALARAGLREASIPNDFAALALLASGKDECRPMLAEYAKAVGKQLHAPEWWWHYGYGDLFLAEYYMATQDKAILPVLRETVLEIAAFQSGVGTWGHEHKLINGVNLAGYGSMNQTGLCVTIPLALARKAGLAKPQIDRALAKSAAFMRWYVGKGSLPYGDHDPWMEHEDNGKNSMGAVMYDLLGDGEAAEYFSKMATAGYTERERGHTGNYFNIAWALMGVSRSGPNATGAYLKETAWYYDLARRWDGTFAHQGIPSENGDSYGGWDASGSYLLGYGLGIKSLYITGKEPSKAPALTAAGAASVIEDGRHFTRWDGEDSYDDMSDADLFKRLSSWSPIVRIRAARSLGHHKGDYAGKLLTMLDSKNVYEVRGACAALAQLGQRASAAVPKLREILKGDDPALIMLAVEALAKQDDATCKAVTPDLLALATRKIPTDPRRHVQRALATALFGRFPGGPKGIFADSLDYDGDQKPLVTAFGAILQNEDARTRGVPSNTVRSVKDDKQLATYLPAVLDAARALAPSDEMFADEIRTACLDLLARMRISDGMQMCLDQMEPDRWGWVGRVPRCIAALKKYGGNAGELMPKIREMRQKIESIRGENRPRNACLAALDDVIKTIEEDKNPPKLRTAQEAIRGGK